MDETMTLGEFRELTKDLPDDTEIEIFNDCTEEYGIINLSIGRFKIFRKTICICFDHEWNDFTAKNYLKA